MPSGGGMPATKRPILGRQRPDLGGDGAAGTGRDAHETGALRRAAGQRVEPVARLGLDGAQEGAAERTQLVVERQA